MIGLTPLEQLELRNKAQELAGSADDDAGAEDEKIQDFEEDDDYDYGENDGPVNQELLKKEEQKKKDIVENDLLFNVQGIGALKKINGYDVFVKNKDCETSLNYLYRSIKNDSIFKPWVKQILGNWKFMQSYLLPLLIFHKKDRKLSFLACRLIVQLTEYPRTVEDIVTADGEKKISWNGPKSEYYHEMLEILREYKESFLQPQVIAVLMEHLADLLQVKEMTQKHEQMIELIVVIFKQLLCIPDPKPNETYSHFRDSKLQKRLLLMYHEEEVLQAVNYISQDFDTPLRKMLCMHILETHYQIFKHFTPQEIFISREKELEAKKKISDMMQEFKNRRKFVRSTRTSKFGTQLSIKRPDGTRQLVTNIYAKNLEVTNLGKHQRAKNPRQGARMKKENVIGAQESLFQIDSLEDSDKQLIEVIKTYLMDILDNTYNNLVNEIFNQIASNQAAVDQIEDKLHFFKICAFMIQVQRFQAQDNHEKKKKEAKVKAIEQQKQKQQEQSGKTDMEQNLSMLFIQKKQGKELGGERKSQPKPQAQQVQVERVPFSIQIDCIGASLQLQNLDMIYGQLYGRQFKDNKVTDGEFHCALKYMTQFLYIIRDMASSDEEKNIKNAKILQTNVFYKDLCIISRVALKLYDPELHNAQFLHDAIEFTHLMLEMLEEYSKGKILMIRDKKKKRKVKKVKAPLRQKQGNGAHQESSQAKDQNGNDLNEFINEDQQLSDDDRAPYSDYEFEDEEMQVEEHTERQFNFRADFSVLLEYEVVEKYLMVIKDGQQHTKNPFLLKACSVFFKRVVYQIKQTWIFFQLSTMKIFYDYLEDEQYSNQLMKNINIGGNSNKDMQLTYYQAELKNVIRAIVLKFVQLLKTNKMLAVECLFQFQTKDIKDQILANYDVDEETMKRNSQANLGFQRARVESEPLPVDFDNFGEDGGNNQENQDIIDRQIEEQKEQDQEGNNNESPADSKGSSNEPEPFVWTQEMDEILITNYKNFSSLGTESCFELLSALIPGTTPKLCYYRGKALKIRKQSEEQARNTSLKLIQESAKNMGEQKIKLAIQKFIVEKIKKDKRLSLAQVNKYIIYISEIQKEYAQFHDMQENMLLFGSETDLRDLKRTDIAPGAGAPISAQVKVPFSIVPVTRQDFSMLADREFLKLLQIFGVTPCKGQNVYPRIVGVQKSTFKEQLDLMRQTIPKLLGDGNEMLVEEDLDTVFFDLETIKQMCFV